jgi:hypothetical protein
MKAAKKVRSDLPERLERFAAAGPPERRVTTIVEAMDWGVAGDFMVLVAQDVHGRLWRLVPTDRIEPGSSDSVVVRLTRLWARHRSVRAGDGGHIDLLMRRATTDRSSFVVVDHSATPLEGG